MINIIVWVILLLLGGCILGYSGEKYNMPLWSMLPLAVVYGCVVTLLFQVLKVI